MNRTEYIHKLQASLTGKIPPSEIADSVAYYEDYFDTQIRNGKTEEEIVNVLGNPRLIANSIIQASKHADETAYTGEENNYSGEEDSENIDNKTFLYWINNKLPRWIRNILMILVTILIIYLVALFLRAFLPIIIGIFLVVFIIKVFQNWKH